MKSLNIFFILIFTLTLLTYCQQDKQNSNTDAIYPPMPDFNLSGSDQQAMAWADSVMEAMGGYSKWQETRYLVWNFFGRRDLYWDKYTGDVRIDFNDQDLTILTNIHSGEGKVSKDGVELTQPDSLSKYLTMGKNIWINDAYWLVMPFKLKDSGVTLKYKGNDTLPSGGKAQVLQLTFNEVGVTPQNKYLVYIDTDDHLIKQWAYFNQAENDSANFIRPWDNYQDFNGLLLSTDRSDQGGPRQVKVPDQLPPTVFTSLDPVEI